MFRCELIGLACTFRSVDLAQIYGFDPQAREVLENFTECEMALNRLSKEPITDIVRIREYRHIQVELEAEIDQILTRQT